MILSTSAIDARERMARAGFFYLAVTLVCAAFGAVYEIFSHGYTHTLCFTLLRFPFAVAYCPVFCLPIPGCICHAGLHKAYAVQALPPVP